MALGTLSITEFGPGSSHVHPGGLVRYDLAWVSDGDGNVEQATTRVQGMIVRMIFDPSAISGKIPSDNYDMTLVDVDGFDVLQTKGANLSNAAASQVLSEASGPTEEVLPFPTCGPLTLTIENAGDSNEGILRLLVRR